MDYVKPETKHFKSAYTALTISGLSFLSAIMNTVFFPFILSPIAIILSALSRGRLKEKHFAAQAATVIAIIAMILNVLLMGFTLYRYQTDTVYRVAQNAQFKEMYGITIDEAVDNIINTQIEVR